ncbi:MAG: hypothetical protein R3Y59_06695 [bacterium]
MATPKNEKKELKKELIDLILKKTNITKSDIINEAMTSFVASNLDLLSKSEKMKYKSIII